MYSLLGPLADSVSRPSQGTDLGNIGTCINPCKNLCLSLYHLSSILSPQDLF